MSTANTALANATAAGFTCPSFEELIAIIAYQVASGSGGGGASFLSGTGSPAGTVNATSAGQTYLDTNANNLWIAAASGTGNWVELIGN